MFMGISVAWRGLAKVMTSRGSPLESRRHNVSSLFNSLRGVDSSKVGGRMSKSNRTLGLLYLLSLSLSLSLLLVLPVFSCKIRENSGLILELGSDHTWNRDFGTEIECGKLKDSHFLKVGLKTLIGLWKNSILTFR